MCRVLLMRIEASAALQQESRSTHGMPTTSAPHSPRLIEAGSPRRRAGAVGGVWKIDYPSRFAPYDRARKRVAAGKEEGSGVSRDLTLKAAGSGRRPCVRIRVASHLTMGLLLRLTGRCPRSGCDPGAGCGRFGSRSPVSSPLADPLRGSSADAPKRPP
jgi:hypothetical protein